MTSASASASPTSDVVMHRRFVCVDAAFNEKGHNKFWYITVYKDGTVKTEWGRVDLTKQEKSFPHSSVEAGMAFAEKKIKEKTNKSGDASYQEVKIVNINAGSGPTKLSGASLEQKAIEQIASSDPKVKALVQHLVKTNVHNITAHTNIRYDEVTGLFSTPLGVVGQENIDEARKILEKIAVFVENNDHDNLQAIPLLNHYLMLIPQGFGMKRPTVRLLAADQAAIQNQISILDSLQASLDMLAKAPPKDGQKTESKVWDIRLLLCDNAAEIDRIIRKFKSSMNRGHACSHLKVDQVYDVDIASMTTAFERDGRKIGNIQELWHGTRVGNILSIFSRGLIIPPSNASYCTGRMFGNGVYFSDQSTKSLNYSYGYWDGRGSDSECFMFLVEVGMGKAYTPRGPRQNLPEPGYDSTFAQGGLSGVANNEMIVYRASQARITKLIKFKG